MSVRSFLARICETELMLYFSGVAVRVYVSVRICEHLTYVNHLRLGLFLTKSIRVRVMKLG